MSVSAQEECAQNASTQPMLVAEPLPLPPAITAPRPGRRRYVVGGIIAVLILAIATLSYFRAGLAPGPGAGLLGLRPAQEMPPSLRPYYDRAVDGDASAMRMLGTMYYNGLNVPQDTKEGIRWYRKAAAAGSVAAGKDLEQLGLPQTEP